VDDTSAQFQLLRAHVEREVEAPGVIIVTSAERGDGKSVTAYSLAQCLARAGRRAALVAGSGPFPKGAPPAATELGDEAVEAFSIVRVRKPATALKGKAATEFLRSTRADYDYTIVDAGPLLADDFALGLVGRVDGVIVSVRLGRSRSDEDEMTVRVIEQSNGRIVGVVAVLPSAIADFANRRPAERVSDSGRRVTAGGGLAAMQSLAASGRT
jgi:Mrp family chromosome partitioning ATPase